MDLPPGDPVNLSISVLLLAENVERDERASSSFSFSFSLDAITSSSHISCDGDIDTLRLSDIDETMRRSTSSFPSLEEGDGNGKCEGLSKKLGDAQKFDSTAGDGVFLSNSEKLLLGRCC
jgi:hypothetical protein